MKVFLKEDPTRIGNVENVFCLPTGQKRAIVSLDNGFGEIEDNIKKFELIEEMDVV